jgi:molecular chaperone DnaJ
MDKKSAVRDYYYILGVSSNATSKQIQVAYDELYQKFGPHVSAEELDPDAMLKAYKDICEAYEVLMDPKRRQEYDRKSAEAKATTNELRDLWMKKTGVNPVLDDQPDAPKAHGAGSFLHTKEHKTAKQPEIVTAEHHVVRDTNRHAVAHQGQASSEYTHPSNEHDDQTEPTSTFAGMHPGKYEVDLYVTLKEAFKGSRKEIRLSDATPCEDCAGLKPVARLQCPTCRGLGTFNVERVEEVDLPSGMYEGMEINLAGRGKYDPRSGQRGDMLLKISLIEHPLLVLDGKDIKCRVPVTLYEAMLGAEIQAPCATGKVNIKIQPLTQPGRVYRLKGLGLAGGDQLVEIEVVLPSRLSGDEVAIFKKLKEGYKETNPRDALFNK